SGPAAGASATREQEDPEDLDPITPASQPAVSEVSRAKMKDDELVTTKVLRTPVSCKKTEALPPTTGRKVNQEARAAGEEGDESSCEDRDLEVRECSRGPPAAGPPPGATLKATDVWDVSHIGVSALDKTYAFDSTVGVDVERDDRAEGLAEYPSPDTKTAITAGKSITYAREELLRARNYTRGASAARSGEKEDDSTLQAEQGSRSSSGSSAAPSCGAERLKISVCAVENDETSCISEHTYPVKEEKRSRGRDTTPRPQRRGADTSTSRCTDVSVVASKNDQQDQYQPSPASSQKSGKEGPSTEVVSEPKGSLFPTPKEGPDLGGNPGASSSAEAAGLPGK
ncbi:unnamed protein product, partial [Amoebophrya sp. A120]